ncbi:hypothetical protein GJAV_G00265830 [Gymnothorax javanicus]|nr:hypothetical protein GJAV_G00265830 [Gymnothorax javanicus]
MLHIQTGEDGGPELSPTSESNEVSQRRGRRMGAVPSLTWSGLQSASRRSACGSPEHRRFHPATGAPATHGPSIQPTRSIQASDLASKCRPQGEQTRKERITPRPF